MVDPNDPDFIAGLYHAVLIEGGWIDVLRRLEDVVSGRGWFLAGHDKALRAPLYRLSTDGLASSADDYQLTVYRENTRMWRSMDHPAGSVVRGSDVMADEEYETTRHYRDFMSKWDLFHIGGIVLHSDPATAVGLGTIRSRPEGDFDEADVARLKALAPHLRNLLHLHDKSRKLAEMATTINTLTGPSGGGLILVDQGRGIRRVNDLAADLLEAGDGLVAVGGRLGASLENENGRLRRLIADLADRPADGPRNGEPIAIQRPSMKAPLQLFVIPVNDGMEQVPYLLDGTRNNYAIFIADPEREIRLEPAILQQLYGLTPKEAALTQELVQGLGLEEAAVRLEVTANTAKTHLRQIFAKTGAKRQAELVRILLAGPAVASAHSALRPIV